MPELHDDHDAGAQSVNWIETLRMTIRNRAP